MDRYRCRKIFKCYILVTDLNLIWYAQLNIQIDFKDSPNLQVKQLTLNCHFNLSSLLSYNVLKVSSIYRSAEMSVDIAPDAPVKEETIV